MIVGTLEYMSPGAGGADQTGRRYAQRRVFAGRRLVRAADRRTPLPPTRGEETGYVDTLQRIREEEPAHLSARVRGSATSAEIAAQRASDISRLPKLLHGELDWIVMKALEKDRARRYETVNGLARDLERYLAGEPVEAGPPSTAYRLRKLAGRHRVGLAMAATVTAACSSLAWWSARGWRCAPVAPKPRRAPSTTFFATTSSRRQAPGRRPRPTPSLTRTSRSAPRWTGQRRASGKVRSAAAARERRSARRSAIRTSDLGLFAEARAQMERALELQRRLLGDEHRDTLTPDGHSRGHLHVRRQVRAGGVTPGNMRFGISRRAHGETEETTRQIS